MNLANARRCQLILSLPSELEMSLTKVIHIGPCVRAGDSVQYPGHQVYDTPPTRSLGKGLVVPHAEAFYIVPQAFVRHNAVHPSINRDKSG